MAASNIGTGLGIALGGRAKDFTQIELAQRRQAAMEEKAKAAAKDKKLEEITKNIYIKPGEYLPFREKEVERMMGEYIEAMTEGGMSYADEQKARFNLVTNFDKLKAEAQEAKKYKDLVAKGQIVVDDDVNILFSAPSADDAVTQSSRGSIYKTEDGTLRVRGYDFVDIPSRQSQFATKFRTEFAAGQTIPGPDGKPMMLGQPNEQDFKRALAADFDQNELVRNNAVREYRSQLEKAGFRGDALLNEAKRLYVENGANFLSGNTIRGAGGTDVNVRVGMGGDETDFQLTPIPFRMNVIHRDVTQKGKETLEEVYVRNFVSTGEEAATIPLSAKAYDASTGEPIDKADFNKGVYNGFGVGYMFTEPMFIEENGVKRYFRPNQLVPERYEDEAIKRGNAQPKKLVFVKIGDASVITEAEPYFMTTINSKDKTLRAIANKQLNLVNDTYNKEMSELDGRRKMLRGGKENPKKPTKEWGGMPSTNQKPVSSQGGGKTEPKKDRVSGNPALQELMKQKNK